MKPRLLLQNHLFSEDEFQETRPIIEKYFEVEDATDIFQYRGQNRLFRGSLSLARVLGNKFEFANGLKWVPYFRRELVNPGVIFTDLSDIVNIDFPAFVRPVSPFKEFAGNVFTEESWKSEYDWLLSKNTDPFLICAHCRPVRIGREWRCIFINGKYVSGSQYLMDGELSIKAEIPEEVIEYARALSKLDYFLNEFEFTIDVAETDDGLKLVELNAFPTASFYAADLDKIYSEWQKSLDNPGI